MSTATAAMPVTPTMADPLEVFRERAEARAHLVGCGELALLDAVDGLQADAECDGLVDVYGQDAVQAIMAQAFGGEP
jgi:hypothetical protein